MPPTAQLQLGVEAVGVEEARAQLLSFIDAARRAGVDVERESKRSKSAQVAEQEKAANRITAIEQRKNASIAVAEAKSAAALRSLEERKQADIIVLKERAALQAKQVEERKEADLLILKQRALDQQKNLELRHQQTLERARQQAADKQRARIEQQTKSTNDILQGLQGMVAGYVSLQGVERAWEAGKQGATALAVDKAFAKIGFTAEDLDKTMKALGFTVEQDTTRKLMNMAQTFRFSGAEIEQMARVARASAVKTGQDTEFLFNSIVTGTARQSALILDNLGILIDVTKAEEKYALQLGKKASKLTDVEKRQAFVNEVMRQGNKIIADAPYDKLSENLGAVDAGLKNILSTMKKMAAEKFFGPLAEMLTGNYQGNDSPDARIAANQRGQQLRAGLEQVDPSQDLEDVKQTLLFNDQLFEIANISQARQLQLRSAIMDAVDTEKAVIEARNELATELRKAERQNREFQQELANVAVLDNSIAEDATTQKAKAEKKAEEAAEKKRKAQEEAEKEAKRAASARKREIEDLRKNWGATLDFIEKTVQGTLTKAVDLEAEAEKRAIAASTAGIEKFKADSAAREQFLLREAHAIQDILDRNTDLDEFTRKRLGRERDKRLGQVSEEGGASFHADREAALQQQAASEVQQGGMLALLSAQIDNVSPDKIAAIGDALHSGIVTPMSIAADTARDFGMSMSDAAAAAILEGKSIRNATNDILKSLARRALSFAIFEGAAALASLAILDFRGAALHGKAAATFGIVAAVTGAGAYATGGLGSDASKQAAPARGAAAPRTAGDARTQNVVNNVYYISYTGLRNRREDQEFLFDLMNEAAGREGSPRIDPRLVPGLDRAA